MSHRLQVLLDESDYRQIQRLAKKKGMSVAQWVRDAIASAAREQPTIDVERKLAVIREAAKGNDPIGDIEQVNAEIMRGYLEEFRDIPEPE